MKRAQITLSDIITKMHEANALHFDDVLAVVVETTVDISILRQTKDDRDIDSRLMENVVG